MSCPLRRSNSLWIYANYVFYHRQDTERAVEGFGLYLSYGACDKGAEPALAIGHALVAALEMNGLSLKWDGCWDHRIHVPLDWKRRRQDK